MRADQDAIMLVRADLCERLATIQALSKRLSARDFAENVIEQQAPAGHQRNSRA